MAVLKKSGRYYYLPDLVLLSSRSGIITQQIWYYYLPNLVLPLNNVDHACHFCDISVFQLKPLSQVGGSSGNPRDHSSHHPFCRLPSLHLHHHQNQGFVLQALQLHRILGISEYPCYYEDFPLIPTKVRSMESTNMGKFKNPLRNLNVIYVMIIAIFTALHLMVT